MKRLHSSVSILSKPARIFSRLDLIKSNNRGSTDGSLTTDGLILHPNICAVGAVALITRRILVRAQGRVVGLALEEFAADSAPKDIDRSSASGARPAARNSATRRGIG